MKNEMEIREAINLIKMHHDTFVRAETLRRAEEVVFKASEKQIPMKPKIIHRIRGGVERQECPNCKHKYLSDTQYEEDSVYCPNCGKYMDGITNNFCDHCGQKIDWSDVEE